jgi:general secretion pathway protein L
MIRRLTGAIGDITTWWGGQLAGLVPGVLRRALRGERGEVIFAFDGDTLALARRRGGHEEALGKVDLSACSPAQARRQARRKLGRLDPDRATVVLRLPSGGVLRQSVELPLAAEENLAEVMAFEMDRRTPFKAEEVYYDQRVTGRDATAQRLSVDLAVAPRRVVDDALALAANWRLWPDRIEVPDDSAATAHLDLMPPRNRRGGGVASVLHGFLLLAALGLAAAAVAIPLEQKRQVAEHLRSQVVAARAEAAEAAGLREEIARRLSGGRGIVARRAATPLRLAVLDQVTALLPDDAWAFQLRIDNDELQVHGYAASAAPLLGRFEEAPMLTNARFRSPLTRDQRLNLERFHVSAELDGEPAP